ncbi:hypothetical protein [Clostridium tagluense]|uniref:hypothetical protein n=1 Tax=Clostridium tagluense TaxID=360422 RepID=UPI001CF39F64|nr:hypothetical protein [Clostridium tagluense]MCB2300121.1 hypothetical protein [Clostridium tagluense]
MNRIFICPSCGNMNNNYKRITNVVEDSTSEKNLCSCGQEILMKHSYPLLQAVDLIITSEQLYEICNDTDKNNRATFLKFAGDDGINFSHQELINYITINETIRSKYTDNDPEKFSLIYDEFENQIISKYKAGYNKIDCFVVYDRSSFRNKFRKTFVIIVASVIEMLFNEFFDILILKKLGNEGGKIFLSRYDHTGVKECIDICNAFVDEPLKIKMDNIKEGFFDRWGTLRNERNSIIHSNNKYISRKRTNEIYKLIEESILIFSNFKSQVYSQNITNG